jgi:hypothetical protein
VRAGGVLAGEHDAAVHLGQRGVVAARRGDRVGAARPRVAGPGRQDGAPRLELEVGAQLGQRGDPALRAVGDPQPLERPLGAGERVHHRLDLAGGAGGPGPVALGDGEDGAGRGAGAQRDEQLRGVAGAHPRQGVAQRRRYSVHLVCDRRRHGDDDRPGLDLLEARDRVRQPDPVAEPGGQRAGKPLVAAGDPVRRCVAERRNAAQFNCRDVIGERCGRDLHARANRLAHAGGLVEAVEQRRRGAASHLLVLERPRDRGRGLPQLLLGDRLAAARLAPPVRHALLPQAEPEPARGLLDARIAGQDELGAHLDHAAARKLARPHAPADPVARLEHDHLAASPREGLGGRQAREAGADDGDVGQAAALLPNRRSRSALSTTETLENAIASPAITGLRNPAAASGSAATL